jgi:hypothetical protein
MFRLQVTIITANVNNMGSYMWYRTCHVHVLKCLPNGGYKLPKHVANFTLLIIRGVSKTLGEWYQKTNKIEDTNKLTLLAFKVIAILHNTLLAKFIKLPETLSKGLLWELIAEPLSHVLGLPPRLQNVRFS